MRLSRRRFLAAAATLLGGWRRNDAAAGGMQPVAAGGSWPGAAHPFDPASRPEAVVMTVRGPIPPAAMGRTLPHEHVLVDFIGADGVSPDRYDPEEAFQTALPHLKQLRSLGFGTLVECTPAYLGRDPLLLRRLSEAADIHLLTNTGFYGARNDAHLPPYVFDESAGEIAARWVQEWEEGIDGTGVRPGFMKIGVDPGPLSEVDGKLVRAAALAHLKTGLTIGVHTGPFEGAMEQLDILASEGVHPSAWIWIHAQAEEDQSRHVAAARRGAWVEFDGISPRSVDRHVEFVLNMKAHELLHRVLVSHDAGWYHVGEPGGGTFRPFDTVETAFLPALRRAGLAPDEIRQLLVTNPAEAFSIRVRT
jgi:phosphotriesterase-related protein